MEVTRVNEKKIDIAFLSQTLKFDFVLFNGVKQGIPTLSLSYESRTMQSLPGHH